MRYSLGYHPSGTEAQRQVLRDQSKAGAEAKKVAGNVVVDSAARRLQIDHRANK